MTKYPFYFFGIFCLVLGIQGTTASASNHLIVHQKAKHVENMRPEELRKPDETEKFYQLYSTGYYDGLNPSGMPCGSSDKELFIIKSSRVPVCISKNPIEKNGQTKKVDENKTRDAKNKADAEKQLTKAEERLSEAEKEEKRIRSMIEKGDAALELSETELEKAKKRLKRLEEKTDATDNRKEKITLITEQIEQNKSMLAVEKEKTKLENMVTGFKGKLKKAERETALAKNNLEQAKQASARAGVKKPAAPILAARNSNPTIGQKLSGSPKPQPQVSRKQPLLQQSDVNANAAAKQKIASVELPKPAQRLSKKPIYNVQKAPSRVVRKKTPVQEAMEEELLEQYDGDKKTIEKVALNADYAIMASAYKMAETPKISGWKRAETFDAYKNYLTGSNSANVYESISGKEIVVAFEGSNDAGDWIGTNRKSLTLNSETGQVSWVKRTAQKIVDKYPNRKVTFVGHSLGGRLAQVARMETGANAVVFDSATLSATELARERIQNYSPKTLTIFRSPGDPVSTLSTKRGIEVRNFIHGNKVSDHSIEQLAEAMQTVKKTWSWMDQ